MLEAPLNPFINSYGRHNRRFMAVTLASKCVNGPS
jgi:hypothetical protein